MSRKRIIKITSLEPVASGKLNGRGLAMSYLIDQAARASIAEDVAA